MKTKQYYKVVREHFNFPHLLVSASYMCGPGMAGVKYSLNNWTIPHAGHNPFLFVFDSRESARKFKRSLYVQYYKIFKCQVKNPSLEKENILGKVPVGTVLVDAVKITKRVY